MCVLLYILAAEVLNSCEKKHYLLRTDSANYKNLITCLFLLLLKISVPEKEFHMSFEILSIDVESESVIATIVFAVDTINSPVG